jgi:uncharacterized protein YecT (DUF1311 family)
VRGTVAAGQTLPTQLPASCSAYDAIPLPAEAEKIPAPTESPDCASYRSYRGIGRPVNYADARACAWKERLAGSSLGQNQKEPIAWVVGGPLILADIYFNGAGVERNIPLAMRFACEFEEGAAMLALPDIEKLDGELPVQEPFEFCHYAETTFTMNFCSGYAAQIADNRRNRYYDSLEAAMTAEQKSAFEKLLDSKDVYIKAHAAEVDQGGSIRTIRTTGSEEILEDAFRTDMVHFERNQWPSLSDAQISSAADSLRGEFEKKLVNLKKQSKEALDEGAVSADGFSDAEKAWEVYRDAWVGFARTRYPSKVDQIRAKVTLDRYRLVKTISVYGD